MILLRPPYRGANSAAPSPPVKPDSGSRRGYHSISPGRVGFIEDVAETGVALHGAGLWSGTVMDDS